MAVLVSFRSQESLGRRFSQPRARVALIRREVKERWAALILPVFVAMGSPAEIFQAVEAELANYSYIFPSGSTVRIISNFYDHF